MPSPVRRSSRRKRAHHEMLEEQLAAAALRAAGQRRSMRNVSNASEAQLRAESDWAGMLADEEADGAGAVVAQPAAAVPAAVAAASAAPEPPPSQSEAAENVLNARVDGLDALLLAAAEEESPDSASASHDESEGQPTSREESHALVPGDHAMIDGSLDNGLDLPAPPAVEANADIPGAEEHHADAAASDDDAGAGAFVAFPGREDGRMPIGPQNIEDVMKAVREHNTQGVVARPVRVVTKAKRGAVIDMIAARMAEVTSQLAKGADFHAQQAAIFALLRVPGDLQPAATRSDRQGRAQPPRKQAKRAAGKGYEGLPPELQHVVKAMRSGDMSKAGRLLQCPAQVSELTAESLHLLATKHPLDTGERVDMTVTAADQVKVVDIQMSTLKSVVFGTPNGRAAGPSGWTFELLKLTMSTERGKQALLELVQQLAVGGYAHNSALMTCGLTVLGKKGGGVRPIAVAEPIVSVVSKCLAREVRERIASHFRGHQFAGGMKYGIDAAITKVKHSLVERAGAVVMSVDIANAFNEGFRGPMWHRTKAALPEVLPWVAMLYGTESPLHVQGVRVLHSRAGQRQGDALSMLLFCITLQPALERAEAAMRDAGHKADIAAYADDVKVVGSREACAVFLEHFEASVAEIGLRVNRSKTEYYDPLEQEGTMLFGAPVGTAAYVRKQAQEVLDSCQQLANQCILLAEEGFVAEADQLLRRCIRPKAAALLRVTELPSDMLGAANTWLITSLRLILGIPSLGWAHTAKSPSAGGLAFPKLVNTARAAEVKAKEQLHGVGFYVTYEPTHPLFMAILPCADGEEPVDYSAVPQAPAVEEETGTRSADEKRKAGKVFTALPQWIMSAAQCVPGNMYKAAIRAHLGMARMPVGLAAAHLRRYTGVTAAWENLRLATKLPNPHDRKEMRAALRGCGSFIRTRLSFALLFDVAEMAATHMQWQQRKQRAAGRF
ncbi:MAG: hypothetical protein GY813_08240 [Halieaceae bacterium]|nr:hypothetical protein [Halieaceae bacterium]